MCLAVCLVWGLEGLTRDLIGWSVYYGTVLVAAWVRRCLVIYLRTQALSLAAAREFALLASLETPFTALTSSWNSVSFPGLPSNGRLVKSAPVSAARQCGVCSVSLYLDQRSGCPLYRKEQKSLNPPYAHVIVARDSEAEQLSRLCVNAECTYQGTATCRSTPCPSRVSYLPRWLREKAGHS